MSKIRNALLKEASKQTNNKGKMLSKLHQLDDQIEDFIDNLEDEVNKTQDNPTFVKRCNTLLANMSKEYSEFIMALRAVVNAIDRKSKIAPMFKSQESKVRDVRSGMDGEEQEEAAEE